jgi:hypothetical protein
MKGNNIKGTRYMVCSLSEPFEMQEYEFCKDIYGNIAPSITLMATRTLILSPDMKLVLDDPTMICIPYFNQYDS